MLNGERLLAGVEGVNEFDMQTEARQKRRERKTVLQFALSISAFPVISLHVKWFFFASHFVMSIKMLTQKKTLKISK